MADPKPLGITEQEEYSQKRLQRDVRPLGVQILHALRSRETAAGLMAVLIVLVFLCPASSLFALPLGLLLFGLVLPRSRVERLPFRLPATCAGMTDYSAPLPGRRGFGKAAGIFLLGNQMESGEELWVTAKDLLTHMLVFGTTGAGKTEVLVSLASSFVAMGSGFAYTDPKAAPKLAFQIYVLCRMFGRDDDFRIVNYLTAGKPSRGRSPKRMCNTLNPFSVGSAEQLTQLLVSLIPKSEGGNAIFAQNAQTLITGLMYALVDLRDKGEFHLSIEQIRDHLTVDKCLDLVERRDLRPETMKALESSLSTVGWNRSLPRDKQGKNLTEQFSYARAYFGLPLASLADTYGALYKVDMGEVDMPDVIMNRRILVTLLPSLEKAPQELENLGKITLSALRNAISVGLGSRIEGSVQDVLEALPTDSPTPFGVIVDEYAAIPTPGFAEVLTQGRGLGIAAIVASQDYAGIEESDKKGAQQIVANTKVKLAMTLEDPKSTWSLFKELAGEAVVMEAESYTMRRPDGDEDALAYRDSMGAKANRRARIEIRDLQKQIEGEFHCFFKGDIIRGRAFYANPPLKPHYRVFIGRMMRIGVPDDRALQMRFGQAGRLKDLLVSRIRKETPAPDVEIPADVLAQVEAFAGVFRAGKRCGRMDTAIAAFMHWRIGAGVPAERFEAGRAAARARTEPPAEHFPAAGDAAVPELGEAMRELTAEPPAAPATEETGRPDAPPPAPDRVGRNLFGGTGLPTPPPSGNEDFVEDGGGRVEGDPLLSEHDAGEDGADGGGAESDFAPPLDLLGGGGGERLAGASPVDEATSELVAEPQPGETAEAAASAPCPKLQERSAALASGFLGGAQWLRGEGDVSGSLAEGVVDGAFRPQIAEAERMLGASPEASEEMAEEAARAIAEDLRYPQEPAPQPAESGEQEDLLAAAVRDLIGN